MRSFELALARTAGRSLVDPARMKMLWDIAQECGRVPGAMIEVGVYRGGTALLLREALPDRPFVCFDTFAGHPTPNPAEDHPNHHEGRFDDTSLDEVAGLFAAHPNPPFFIAGRFPDTWHTAPLSCGELCFVHVDVDLHDGTLAAYRLLWPLLSVGGAMVCDDYGFDDCAGAKTAVQQFVAETPGARLVELYTQQCVVWKEPISEGELCECKCRACARQRWIQRAGFLAM